MEKHITTPITQKITKDLKSGDYVYITGEMYVARDAAHKRMIEALDRKEELPIDIKDSTIYYMGPSPARDGRPIGSAGPTTATRMDKYAPRLLDLGENAMIGAGSVVTKSIPAGDVWVGNPAKPMPNYKNKHQIPDFKQNSSSGGGNSLNLERRACA